MAPSLMIIKIGAGGHGPAPHRLQHRLGLLIGMMILVSITAKTGLFDYVATDGEGLRRRRLLIYLGFITALFSPSSTT